MEEIWKPIKDFEGYEVSDQGNVRSFWTPVWSENEGLHQVLSDIYRILKKNIHKTRSKETVHLYKNNKRKSFQVHILVMNSFGLPKPFPNAEVDHEDRNPLNNNFSNLRWCNRGQNCSNVVARNKYSKI